MQQRDFGSEGGKADFCSVPLAKTEASSALSVFLAASLDRERYCGLRHFGVEAGFDGYPAIRSIFICFRIYNCGSTGTDSRLLQWNYSRINVDKVPVGKLPSAVYSDTGISNRADIIGSS